jgi:hypothetical protein
MPKQVTPKWTKDGRLDPDWLGSAGLAFVRRWLADRLAGKDPYQPIDHRVGEDPDGFVVDTLREVGAGHPAFDNIARAVAQLLDEARKAMPSKPPAWLPHLLRVCQRIRLPQTSAWFSEEIRELAKDVGKYPNKGEERWGGYEGAKEIVFAAVVQAPGGNSSAATAAWERLLKEPRYTTLALHGLSRAFRDQAKRLGVWWEHCNDDERARELEQILSSAVNADEESNVRSLLCEHGSEYPAELRRAIDAALKELGFSAVFSAAPTHAFAAHERSRTRAIDGAGVRRELLLHSPKHTSS